ncbi:MAG: MBL fold metallo-hydrolase [Alphaproteobacteria bacterium]|nr:MBL fold metallo-hydrolase [Rhodospirillaceae bacterium]MDG2481419.1 MBL fold metallo-hydrolase [Alphaproteobacteria bacterium]MBT6204421.1 MBL fold metallo-hydrolase [Rhodospirillaceae bacterium]MBT6511390.1 MBL fold metallo-hydrolase [Rhodospirillaceae bacterium]MBT7615398.1 MBL fold metallo-hydrolase [Rhodospirillaceae bacterium]
MAADEEFCVRFWGVRGSIPCPGPATVRYGGNTSCLEVRCGPHRIILDAGTGLRELSMALDDGPLDADLFMTHTHLDHVCGWPYLTALTDPGTRLAAWSGHLKAPHTLESVLERFLKDPVTPVNEASLKARIDWKEFALGDTLTPRDGVVVKTGPLNHPNGASGYRVEYAGKSICYITDTEHVTGAPDANVLGLIAGADIVIYDATYTDEEFPKFITWGHSTWEEGVRLCDAAGVKTFVAFHHDPSHDDDRMDAIAADLEIARPGSVVAREGMVLHP